MWASRADIAAQPSAFADINTRIIEQKDCLLELGQADGLACRTLEMFEAFGFSERVIREPYNVVKTVFWGPHNTEPGHIERTGRIQDVEDDLSEFPHLILNQARVRDMLLQVMLRSPRRLQPDYSYRFRSLTQSKADTHLLVEIQNANRESETVRARYVVGCDGARSKVRESIGLELKGDTANQA